MIKEALVWLEQRMKGVVTQQVPDDQYISRPNTFVVELPPAEPLAGTLKFETLSALVTYLAENRDELDLAGHILHVQEINTVLLLGPLQGRHRLREIPAHAVAPRRLDTGIVGGSERPVEDMLNALRAGFEPTDDRDTLIKALSKVTTETEVRQADDGLSQQVTLEAGKMSLGWQDVPSPAILAPRLSFTGEVEAIPHPYILRLRSIENMGVLCRLLLADGGAWERTQKIRVKAQLEVLLNEAKVEEVPVLL